MQTFYFRCYNDIADLSIGRFRYNTTQFDISTNHTYFHDLFLSVKIQKILDQVILLNE